MFSLVVIARTTHAIVITLIPLGTVHHLALEVMKARDVRPLPVIQRTGC